MPGTVLAGQGENADPGTAAPRWGQIRPSLPSQVGPSQSVIPTNGHGGEAVRKALAKTIVKLPTELRRSITWDQGPEMNEHVRFTVDTGVQIYFCDPKSPWQEPLATWF